MPDQYGTGRPDRPLKRQKTLQLQLKYDTIQKKKCCFDRGNGPAEMEKTDRGRRYKEHRKEDLWKERANTMW